MGLRSLAVIAVALSLAAPAVGAPVTGFYAPGSGGFKSVVFYYGWLNTSNLLDINADIVVVSGASRVLPGGPDRGVVDALLARGAEVYAYLHDNTNGSVPVGLGSLYNSTVAAGFWSDAEYVAYVEGLIDQYAGVFTGVFLDECDPSYFGSTSPNDPLVQAFTRDLQEIAEYARSKGLKVFVNGVRAYAALGDYYLWELFLTRINQSTGELELDTGFLSPPQASNPYDWASGAAKLQYLMEKGLLDRTIALTLVEPVDYATAEMGYYAARILGLAGWGYADVTINSGGGPVIPVHAYELGPMIQGPMIDAANGSMSAVFVAGPVIVSLDPPLLEQPYAEQPGDPYIDGSRDPSYIVEGPWPGAYSTLEEAGVYATPYGAYFYANVTLSSPPSTAGLLHVYIDTDNSAATGYSTLGIGADLLVEVYTGGSAQLFTYTGNGSSWSWEALGSLLVAVSSKASTSYRAEIGLPARAAPPGSVAVVAALVNWSVDAASQPLMIPPPAPAPPSIFHKVDTSAWPYVVEATITTKRARLVAEAPAGTVARYVIAVPYESVGRVLVDGAPASLVASLPGAGNAYTVEPVEGYTIVTVQAEHNSPVTILILPASSIGGTLISTGSGYTPVVVAAVIAVLLLARGRCVRPRGNTRASRCARASGSCTPLHP